MSSIKPDSGGRQTNGCREVAGDLVLTRGDRTELFESAEEVLDQVPGLIQVLIVFALFFAVRFGRDDDFDARFLQKIENALLRIVSPVRQKRPNGGEDAGQQGIGSLQIVSLPRRQVKARGIAQRVTARVDFRGQAAFRSPDAFRFPVPPFAPALCWWARTRVESIIAYSLSASSARCLKILCQTPFLLQRV